MYGLNEEMARQRADAALRAAAARRLARSAGARTAPVRGRARSRWTGR